MTVQMRSRLARELSTLGEPALGDLAGAALREGRRQHRAGRLRQGAAVLGAVAAVAAVAVVVPQLLAGPGPTLGGSIVPAAPPQTPSAPAASATQAPSLDPAVPPDLGQGIVPDPGRAAASPEPARLVPATPAGLLLAVIDQLAVHGVNGTEIDGAVAGDGSLFVQVSLTTANGPGMFRLSVSASAPRTIETQPGETLVRHDDGTVVVTGGIANNCIQHAYAYAYRPDGTMVYVGVASCLAWNGRANIATHPPLTLDQAVALATDPAIGRTIAADVEAAGEAKFGHAPTLP